MEIPAGQCGEHLRWQHDQIHDLDAGQMREILVRAAGIARSGCNLISGTDKCAMRCFIDVKQRQAIAYCEPRHLGPPMFKAAFNKYVDDASGSTAP